MERKKVQFTKMHGCGNNYIYVYLPDNPSFSLQQASIAWSRPAFGIGSDGLITIDHSQVADFQMRIFNNDGSEALMCGNGIRCCGKFVRDHGLTDKQEVTFETLAGIKTVSLVEDSEGEVTAARVYMGVPTLENAQQFVPAQQVGEHLYQVGKYVGTYVCMGNPHFVIFVDDVMTIDLPDVGPRMEHHSAFPERCNVEFAQVRKDGSIRMRVWERGSGITLACGTGACATAVAAVLTQKCPRQNQIEMDGGTLTIEWQEDGSLYMTGPAQTVFTGEISI